MTPETLVNVLEAAMLAAGRALTLEDFLALFIGSADVPDRKQLRDALAQLEKSLSGRGIELVEVASGYRLQVREQYSPWLGGLFSERPPRYSRALLETLALIAYRQPVTRGEIENVRGVVVSSNIIKTLMEREWIRVLGHREVPGRPALYGTTREFLDHFGLKGLDGLPPLADIRDLDQVEPDLFAPASIENDLVDDAGSDGGERENGDGKELSSTVQSSPPLHDEESTTATLVLGGASSEARSGLEEWQQTSGDEDAGSEAAGADKELAVESAESTDGESVEDAELGMQAVHAEAGDEHGDAAQGGTRERR